MSSLFRSYGSKGISLTAKGKEDFWTYVEEPYKKISIYLLSYSIS